ncbi:hypothetical protein MY11210_008453 [Beauveria gryllotalpidicola]
MTDITESAEAKGSNENLLPICTTLGCSINLAQSDINPLDIQSVLNSSSKATIVGMSTKGGEVKPPGSSSSYWKPENAVIRDYGANTKSYDLYVETGEELSTKFGADANLSIAYGGLSVSASSQYSYESSFKSTSVYGNYSFDQKVYSVQLADPHKFVNSGLVDEAKVLKPWKQDEATYDKYRLFFEKWGTHVLIECFLGTRYQLAIEKLETSSEKKQEVKACVSLEYKGIVSGGGGAVDDRVYQAYLNTRKSDCLVLGGDKGKAGILARDPRSMEKFNNWQESRKVDAMEALLAAKAESLGIFLAASSVQSHIEASRRLKPALDYFSTFRLLSGVFTLDHPDSRLAEGLADASIGCSITPLPGLMVKPGHANGWTVNQLSPSSFTARLGAGLEEGLPISVTAPMHPVDVTLTSDMGYWPIITSLVNKLMLSPDPAASSGYRTRILAKVDNTRKVVHIPRLDLAGTFGPPQFYGDGEALPETADSVQQSPDAECLV